MTAPSPNPLEARAESRWQEIAADEPELLPAVSLQRQLLHEILQLAGGLEIDERDAKTPPAALQQRVDGGVPLLRDEDVVVAAPELRPAALNLCRILATGGAHAAVRIAQALEAGDIDTAALVRALLRRNERAVYQTAMHLSLSPDLLWLVGELLAGPLAVALRRRLVERGGAELGSTLECWNEGYCPACGSWPALAETVGYDRQLRCSFCGCGWRLSREGCVYCGESADQLMTAAPDLARVGRRLELCRACGSYLKVIERPDHSPSLLLTIEDLATSHLDVAAVDRGYVRPPMRRFGDDLPCG